MTKWFASCVVALLCAGVLWESIATARFMASHPAPGKIVDIGDGVALHCVVQGTRRPGQPLVVVDAALGDSSANWLHIARELSESCCVFLWDRPGMGWSPPSDGPRRPQQNVRSLARLLDACGQSPPYLLVGHSMGGHNMRLFAAQYPEKTAGLLLIDAANTDQFGPRDTTPGMPWLARAMGFASRFGGHRALAVFSESLPDELARKHGIDKEQSRGLMLRSSEVRSMMADWQGMVIEGTEQLEKGAERIHLGDLPTTVLSADGPPNAEALRWEEGQALLQEISTDLRAIELNCHHLVNLARPDTIVDEVMLLLAKLNSADAPD